MGKNVVGFLKDHQEELFNILKPYYVQRDFEDAGVVVPAVEGMARYVTLSKETWRIYRDMRDDLIVELAKGHEDEKVVEASNAGVKLVRLLEITAGQLEGQSVGTEKDDDLVSLCEERAGHRVIIWTWFRNQTIRLASRLTKEFPDRPTVMIIGGQTKAVRDAVLRTFNERPDTILVSQVAAGGMGLNMQRAHYMIFATNAYSLLIRVQALGRVERMGQKDRISVLDMIALGPNGEPTIDRLVLKALARKEEMSNWTRGRWLDVLKKEKAGLRTLDLF